MVPPATSLPGISTAGTYTVTYTLPASGGCASGPINESGAWQQLVPVATITYAGTPSSAAIGSTFSRPLEAVDNSRNIVFNSRTGICQYLHRARSTSGKHGRNLYSNKLCCRLGGMPRIECNQHQCYRYRNLRLPLSVIPVLLSARVQPTARRFRQAVAVWEEPFVQLPVWPHASKYQHRPGHFVGRLTRHLYGYLYHCRFKRMRAGAGNRSDNHHRCSNQQLSATPTRPYCKYPLPPVRLLH